jgi:DNA-binding transcriptional ArsR family regulator
MEINALDYLSRGKLSKCKKVSLVKSQESRGSYLEIFELLNAFVIKHENQGYFSHLFFSDDAILRTIGMPYSTFMYKLSKLEEWGILLQTNERSFKRSEATEFYLDKTKFIIHYFLKTIFESMGEKVKRSLKYRKCRPIYTELFNTLIDTITEIKPLPIHSSVLINTKSKKLEDQVINTIYLTFFNMINEYIPGVFAEYSFAKLPRFV